MFSRHWKIFFKENYSVSWNNNTTHYCEIFATIIEELSNWSSIVRLVLTWLISVIHATFSLAEVARKMSLWEMLSSWLLMISLKANAVCCEALVKLINLMSAKKKWNNKFLLHYSRNTCLKYLEFIIILDENEYTRNLTFVDYILYQCNIVQHDDSFLSKQKIWVINLVFSIRGKNRYILISSFVPVLVEAFRLKLVRQLKAFSRIRNNGVDSRLFSPWTFCDLKVQHLKCGLL